MPVNVFGNQFSSSEKDIKNDTSSFVQKPYLGTKYNESNVKENIDMKNQFRIKNIPDPISIRETASKNYVDNEIKNFSVTRKASN